jgi:signal transduction histidine kinase
MEQDVSGSGAAMHESRAAHQRDERQDHLLVTLGHELKTPITVIKGSVQLARHRLQAAGHQQEAAWLEVANSQIDRLTALVDYLLRAGQLNSSGVDLHLAPFNLADLVREVGITMEALSPEHTLIIQAPEDVAVEADADRLAQVLHNLIGNAVKYSPAGSTVEITLRRVGGEAELCVRDYGIGIPSEDRDRVFERFERATNVGLVPGFGLGLTMCRDIVNAHHGRLWVGDLAEAATTVALNSEPPPAAGARGSLICVALPLEQDARS